MKFCVISGTADAVLDADAICTVPMRSGGTSAGACIPVAPRAVSTADIGDIGFSETRFKPVPSTGTGLCCNL